MINPINHIVVNIENKKVGRLALSPDHLCLFEYDHDWIRSGFSISPFYLPLKSGVFISRPDPFNGLFGVFNDSLPDGWGKLLIDRWLLNHGINPGNLSPLDRLSLVGNSGMGALKFQPSQNFDVKETSLSLDFYATEIEKILHNVSEVSSLDEMINKAGSSGGARPKVLLNIDGKEWMVKFRASADPADVGVVEYQYSLLAKKCGIEMAETCLFEGKYFGAQRFDRVGNKRIHVHTASGLLYASYRLPSLDYTELMKATLLLTKNFTEVEKIFRLMVFNVLIENKDDHARNFSFIYRDNSWQLSPAYDLLPSDGFNGNHTTTVNGKGKPTLSDCIQVAKLTAFPVKKAERIIEEVKTALE
jgi:serine/threonine-protein kinase HipA